jgi:hypothetical protein
MPAPAPIKFVADTPGGDFNCIYDPAPMVGEIIHFYGWFLCPPVTVVDEYIEEHGYENEAQAKDALATLYCERMQICVSTACNYALRHAETYLRDSLVSLYDDAINRTFVERNGEAFIVEPVEGVVVAGSRAHRKKLRRLMNLPTHGGKRRYYHDWTDEECIKLADLHERLWPLMKMAKAIYLKHPANYREEVEFLFLSNEDIENLSHPDPYVSSPVNLALMSAAQEIGLAPGLYSLRQLHRYLKIGRNLKRNRGVSEKEFLTIKVWV